MNKALLLLAMAVMVAGLSACGGTSSGGNDPDDKTTPSGMSSLQQGQGGYDQGLQYGDSYSIDEDTLN